MRPRRGSRRTPWASLVFVEIKVSWSLRVKNVNKIGETGQRRLTGVEMAVKVNDRHGPVRPVDGAQQGQGDGVVSTEGDDPGEGLGAQSRAGLVCIGSRGAAQDLVVALLNLAERPGVVVSVANMEIVSISNSLETSSVICHLAITYDVTGMSPQSRTLAQLLKGLTAKGTLYPPLYLVSMTLQGKVSNTPIPCLLEVEATRALTDARWSEASTRTVRSTSVEWGA